MCILEIHIDIQVTKDMCMLNITKVTELIESTEMVDMINVIEGIKIFLHNRFCNRCYVLT